VTTTVPAATTTPAHRAPSGGATDRAKAEQKLGWYLAGPAFVVMLSRDRHGTCGQLLFEYYWGSGFLPSEYQGVKFRPGGDPVLYLSNPAGVSANVRRGQLDDLAKLNRMKLQEAGDPEKLAADFRKFIESEIEKARPRKSKSLTPRKPSADPTSGTDAPVGLEQKENTGLPSAENRGEVAAIEDEDDLIG